jgi:di/tricarboxylate transporter
MQAMSTWEMLLLGVLVLLVLFWFGPGIKATMEKSRQAEQRDWAGFLLPIALVVLFVLFLMSVV